MYHEKNAKGVIFLFEPSFALVRVISMTNMKQNVDMSPQYTSKFWDLWKEMMHSKGGGVGAW